MDHAPGHVPVLIRQVVESLAPKPGETYLDCTAGLGGHAATIARSLAPNGTVVLNDMDAGNLSRAEEHVRQSVRELEGIQVVTLKGNFAEAPRQMAERGLRADLVLADLGFSSNQVDDASRGLSFMRDGPLDMRLDASLAMSAGDLVRSASEAELARIIREYGEDRAASTIAWKIVQARQNLPITTTAQLAEIVRSAYGAAADRQAIHPATRTFQALRIAVNDELGSLEALLFAVSRGASETGRGGWLQPGARVGVISFHSLEDRIVKGAFADLVKRGLAEHVGKGPIEADESEVRENVRARSAKLRVVRIVDSSSGERRG